MCQPWSIYLCQLRAIVWHINVKSRQVNNMYVDNSHNNWYASTAQNNTTACQRISVKPFEMYRLPGSDRSLLTFLIILRF